MTLPRTRRLEETHHIIKGLGTLGDIIITLREKSEKSNKHILYQIRREMLFVCVRVGVNSSDERGKKTYLFLGGEGGWCWVSSMFRWDRRCNGEVAMR